MSQYASSVIDSSGIIRSDLTPELRKRVYERDNYTCQDCGLIGNPGRSKGNIQAHHLQPISASGEHTLSNLITVCLSCHQKRHSKGWREKARTIFNSKQFSEGEV